MVIQRWCLLLTYFFPFKVSDEFIFLLQASKIVSLATSLFWLLFFTEVGSFISIDYSAFVAFIGLARYSRLL